jgi:hypothetical protein
VHATLTLVGSRVRTTPPAGGDYAWSGPEDTRFHEYTGPVQSIATSHGQSDMGLFEQNLRDERYLPFEGRGAISDWHLRLDKDANRFDLTTITDVLIHVNYTAREGGEPLAIAAKDALPQERLQLLSARHELSDAWHRFLHPADDATEDVLELDLTNRPPVREGETAEIQRVDVYLRLRDLPTTGGVPDMPLELYASDDATTTDLLSGTPLVSIPSLDGIHFATVDLSAAPASAASGSRGSPAATSRRSSRGRSPWRRQRTNT